MEIPAPLFAPELNIAPHLPAPPQQYNWQALQVYSLYRFILALTFLILGNWAISPTFSDLISKYNSMLYFGLSNFLLLLSILGLIFAILKWPHYALQVHSLIPLDLGIILLIMHASGGITSGLGILLNVTIAAHSILMPGRLPLLSAALASLGLLSEQLYSHLTWQAMRYEQAGLFQDKLYYGSVDYLSAGLLGLGIFATALATNLLSFRIKSMHQLAYQRGQQLEMSRRLNAVVIATMQEGVIIYNTQQQIQLINSAAKKLLALKPTQSLLSLKDLPVRFQHALQHFHLTQQPEPPFQITKTAPQIKIECQPLQNEQATVLDTLVFVSNITKEIETAQSLKLASLGRLTANIAHEIRNPLSAASHAAQLLLEKDPPYANPYRLAQIIKKNCDRINEVIKNVLSLSRKEPSFAQSLCIKPWLEQFVAELSNEPLAPTLHLLAEIADDLTIDCDPSQLRQILTNICENGLRYSRAHTGVAQLELQLRMESGLLYIEIIDCGPGMDQKIRQQLFEPFVTTEYQGSGLGLYIAHQLCQMNGATIACLPASTGGCKFQLCFGLSPNKE